MARLFEAIEQSNFKKLDRSTVSVQQARCEARFFGFLATKNVSSSDFASIVFIARLALSSLEFPFALVNSEAEIRHVVSWELIFGPEIFLGFDCCLHRLSRSNFRIIS